MLALSLAEALEQVANGVVDGKARDPQRCVQVHIRPQQAGVREPSCSGHHREQEGREGLYRIDRVG